MRRRRNPDLGEWALVAGIGVAAYLLYKYVTGALSTVATAVSTAASATSSKIADVAEILLPHTIGAMVPTATILLGTGAEIPVSAVSGVGQFTDLDGVTKFQFYYAGQIWRTTGSTPDETNTYYATSGR
jgi:hypothetical protein